MLACLVSWPHFRHSCKVDVGSRSSRLLFCLEYVEITGAALYTAWESICIAPYPYSAVLSYTACQLLCYFGGKDCYRYMNLISMGNSILSSMQDVCRHGCIKWRLFNTKLDDLSSWFLVECHTLCCNWFIVAIFQRNSSSMHVEERWLVLYGWVGSAIRYPVNIVVSAYAAVPCGKAKLMINVNPLNCLYSLLSDIHWMPIRMALYWPHLTPGMRNMGNLCNLVSSTCQCDFGY